VIVGERSLLASPFPFSWSENSTSPMFAAVGEKHISKQDPYRPGHRKESTKESARINEKSHSPGAPKPVSQCLHARCQQCHATAEAAHGWEAPRPPTVPKRGWSSTLSHGLSLLGACGPPSPVPLSWIRASSKTPVLWPWKLTLLIFPLAMGTVWMGTLWPRPLELL